ncbi:hypothetical protein NC651_033806 [Populus alba x Populus x berolinensis]|nr:hypothetical protein NC651_033806 [Populus alba x Populus x berolinensis]
MEKNLHSLAGCLSSRRLSQHFMDSTKRCNVGIKDISLPWSAAIRLINKFHSRRTARVVLRSAATPPSTRISTSSLTQIHHFLRVSSFTAQSKSSSTFIETTGMLLPTEEAA